MRDFEIPGEFYLGREYDLASGTHARRLESLRDRLAAAEIIREGETSHLNADYRDPQIETYPIGPRKRDISIEKIMLPWVP